MLMIQVSVRVRDNGVIFRVDMRFYVMIEGLHYGRRLKALYSIHVLRHMFLIRGLQKHTLKVGPY